MLLSLRKNGRTSLFKEVRVFNLRIGNGVGKQGYGNRPPIDDRNPIRKFSIDCLYASKTNGTQLTHHGRESKRKADTEIQYRPHIVDTDIDCGPRFCGPRFRDSYSRSLGPLGQGKCGKCGRPLSPCKNKGLRRLHRPKLGGRFGYLYYFFVLGGGEGGARGVGKGAGGGLLLKIPGGGGGVLPGGRGRGARGWEGVCGDFGGGLNIFFGAESPTKQNAESKEYAEMRTRKRGKCG